MRKQTEHNLQVSFFKWCAWKSKEKGFEPLKLIFAIPNGGHRNIITATRMKAEGVKAGVPDIFLPQSVWMFKEGYYEFWYHGLFLEAKSEKRRLSDAQKEWFKALREAGYAVTQFKTLDEARAIVANYLNGTLKITETTK